MTKKIILILMIVFSIFSCSTSSVDGVISYTPCAFREAPSNKAKTVGTLKLYQQVKVLGGIVKGDNDVEYYKIDTGKQVGYVGKNNLQYDVQLAVVNDENATYREKPDAKPAGFLPKETVVYIISEEEGAEPVPAPFVPIKVKINKRYKKIYMDRRTLSNTPRDLNVLFTIVPDIQDYISQHDKEEDPARKKEILELAVVYINEIESDHISSSYYSKVSELQAQINSTLEAYGGADGEVKQMDVEEENEYEFSE